MSNPYNTVFVQVSDRSIRTQIEKWANARSLEIFLGSGFDLIAIGCLLAVVEKTELGEDVWQDYIEYLRESEDRTPCIVINSTRNKSEEDIQNLHYAPDTKLTDWTHTLDVFYKKRGEA